MEIVAEMAGRCALLHLSGRFDVHSSVQFRGAYRPLLHDGDIESLALDFSGVPYLDSSGLGMLLLLREQATAAGKSVVLTHCGPDLQGILSLAHFERIFHIE